MLRNEISELKRILPELEIRENEPLKKHTSFHIGGPAKLMMFPRNAFELEKIVKALLAAGEKTFIMGNGSNLLFSDEGYNGIVIKACGSADGLKLIGENTIRAESGVLLSQTAAFARKNSLGGMEFAHGIPGSVGGAIIMNAGAYGGEMADITVKTVYLDGNGEKREVFGEEHCFSYRRSRFCAGDTILYSEFRLLPADGEEIQKKMNELAEKRRKSQPLELPSAGSAFKRPAGGYAAALIDSAGLKGLSSGGAQVSEKHAGFIVNTGGATCRDVLTLIEEIQKRVFEFSGIRLETEIKTVGADC